MREAVMTIVLLAGVAGAGLAGQAPAEPAPPAPKPGSPATYKASAELLEALAKATPRPADASRTAAVSNTDQYRVNLVHRPKPGPALAHPGNTELHYITDGAATIVTGGQLVRPPQPGAAATIVGGVSRRVVKGDVVIVPADSPHWYQEVEGSITYLEVRFVAPKP